MTHTNLDYINTHEDTLKVIHEEHKKSKREMVFYFLFALMSIFWIILIGSTLLDLRKVEQPVYYFQCVEEYTATINGQRAKICKHSDKTYSTRVYYENCEDVATIKGWVNYCDREYITVKW